MGTVAGTAEPDLYLYLHDHASRVSGDLGVQLTLTRPHRDTPRPPRECDGLLWTIHLKPVSRGAAIAVAVPPAEYASATHTTPPIHRPESSETAAREFVGPLDALARTEASPFFSEFRHR